MSIDAQSELQQFHAFIGQQLANKTNPPTPEEAVDQWREQHPAPEDFEQDVLAVRQALQDMEAGDTGVPFEEFDREFRARHGLPPRT